MDGLIGVRLLMEKIKQLLKTEDYDFLRTDEHLGKNIILLTLGEGLG